MRWAIWGMISVASGSLLASRPASMRAEIADRAQEMLVDRVVVIHRELHHADDAAEIGNEPAEHAGLVHAPKRDFRRVARGKDLEEQPVRLVILAQARRRCA